MVQFEAQVFIDGILQGQAPVKPSFRTRSLTHLIGIDPGSLIEVDRGQPSLIRALKGQGQSLNFPAFHRELLTQSYWNAGDEFGRIKIAIVEGLPRDSLLMPFEQVNSVVAFSFQHAPLEVLEASSIAWPNASMWRQMPSLPPHLANFSPSRRTSISLSAIELHSHSPRKRKSLLTQPSAVDGTMAIHPLNAAAFPKLGNRDPLTDPCFTSQRYVSSTDIPMPDYSTSVSQAATGRKVTDSVLTDEHDQRFDTNQGDGTYESSCEALLPSTPDNSPRHDEADGSSPIPDQEISTFAVPAVKSNDGHATSTPTSSRGPRGIRSRKESIQASPSVQEPASIPVEGVRKIAQPFPSATNSGGGSGGSSSSKRQRVVTPAAFRAIDQEDQPRSSPTSRKISQAVIEEDAMEKERRILSGISFNIL
ncbi:MAG: hypothetical protein M1818_007270 [Claussenomyces sp. TS43310]|nr:MAG: hypothetical protein M1818_007270 [Claussenomyces sp. TS43310]